MNEKEMIGQKFGRLTVVKSAPNTFSKGKYSKYWVCKCECGNETIVNEYSLKHGRVKSCKCLQRENASKSRRKYNNYIFKENEVFIYDNQGKNTVIDLEDFEKIKGFYWKQDLNGYWIAFNSKREKSEYIKIHSLIMLGENYWNNYCSAIVCDHKNGDTSDNRKNNLRVVTRVENNLNLGLRNDNTSGYAGVHNRKNDNKWESYISFNKRKFTFGAFIDKKEAILNRMIAQHILFGEYSRQNCIEEIEKLNCDKKIKQKALSNVIRLLKKKDIKLEDITVYEKWLYTSN